MSGIPQCWWCWYWLHDCSCSIGHGDDDGGSSGDSGGVLSACADVDADVDASASPSGCQWDGDLGETSQATFVYQSVSQVPCFATSPVVSQMLFLRHEKSINASDGMDGEIGSLGEARPA